MFVPNLIVEPKLQVFTLNSIFKPKTRVKEPILHYKPQTRFHIIFATGANQYGATRL